MKLTRPGEQSLRLGETGSGNLVIHHAQREFQGPVEIGDFAMPDAQHDHSDKVVRIELQSPNGMLFQEERQVHLLPRRRIHRHLSVTYGQMSMSDGGLRGGGHRLRGVVDRFAGPGEPHVFIRFD